MCVVNAEAVLIARFGWLWIVAVRGGCTVRDAGDRKEACWRLKELVPVHGSCASTRVLMVPVVYPDCPWFIKSARGSCASSRVLMVQRDCPWFNETARGSTRLTMVPVVHPDAC